MAFWNQHKLLNAPLSYRRNFIDHLWHERQAANKGACSNKSPCQLDAKLARHIAERLQLLCVAADTLHVGVTEFVLHIDKPEHPLQEVGPEVGQHGLQVDGCAARHVIPRQVLEEVLEQLRVLHVHHAVCSHKHVVQRDLCIFQKLTEKLWKKKGGGGMCYYQMLRIAESQNKQACFVNISVSTGTDLFDLF